MPRVGAALLVLTLGVAGAGTEAGPPPHVPAADRHVVYAGPGGEAPEPSGLDEVRIAYFGPSDPDHPLGGDPWLAANIAIEEANREGGYRGLPFRLVPSWSESPWGSGVADLARSIYDGGAWAVIGSIDSSATHLAEQVVAKARLTLVNPGGTDRAINLAGVAWIFSCLPGDDEQATALVRAMLADALPLRLAIVSATDHDSRLAAAALGSALAREGLAPVRHLSFEPGTTDLAAHVAAVAESEATSVAVVSGPIDAARLVPLLAELDPTPRVFGTQAFTRRAFLDRVGGRADGATVAWPCSDSATTGPFAATFRSRFGREADCTTIASYDATRLVVAAVRRAGLNRVRIRDAIAAASPWTGQAGAIRWDALGRNERPGAVGTVERGRVVVHAPVAAHAAH